MCNKIENKRQCTKHIKISENIHSCLYHLQRLKPWQKNNSYQFNSAKTRQSAAVQREGGIPVDNKILHPYQNP